VDRGRRGASGGLGDAGVRGALVVAAALTLVGCTPKRAAERADAGATPVISAPAPSASATPPPRPSAAKTAAVIPAGDAGAPACKVLRGPIAQPFHGPAALRIVSRADAEIAQVVFNDNGAPRSYDVLPGDAGALPGEEAGPKSALPPCALTRDVAFCPDTNGAIHRTRGAGEGDTVVARGRSGTRLAAAHLAGRALVAYLGERVTTEGLVREAWAALDDAPPVRISEDGSGATHVDLAARGDTLVAMTIDARVAMTPAHARVLTLEAGKLHVSKDAVIFVGGSAERHNAGALATSKDGATFALVPVSADVLTFGMATIKIDDPPGDDAPVTWSNYPTSLDPAPIAATRGESAMHIARVRPRTSDPKSPRVLEIGTLDARGAFEPRCIAAEAVFVKDVEVALDRQGGLWVFYRDPSASRLLRVATR
jgi:hypothetical protein